MIVNEIFQSIDGEGVRAGKLATFVRLSGCNLRCSYCDTAYALKSNSGKQMTIEEIVKEVDRIAIGPCVTITGGEPLIHAEIYDLIKALVSAYYEVNVETNGSKIPELSSRPGMLFYTMDYKLPSSGEESAMKLEAINKLKYCDVLKFVVGSIEDLNRAAEIIKLTQPLAAIYFSPVFGKIEAKDIVEYMQEHKLSNCKIQLQLHKYIWEPDRRGV